MKYFMEALYTLVCLQLVIKCFLFSSGVPVDGSDSQRVSTGDVSSLTTRLSYRRPHPADISSKTGDCSLLPHHVR